MLFFVCYDKKYQTKVGENGIKLSGGQRQRIGIARALYRKSNLLILDEATSSLDSKTEEKVMKKIIDKNPSLTIIMIAHRLSTIHKADKIFVVKGGEVINAGRHDFLIKNCTEYKSLYEKQLK